MPTAVSKVVELKCSNSTNTYPTNIRKGACPATQSQNSIPEEDSALDEMRQPAEDLGSNLSAELARFS